tara:strand:+ start:777 stop:1001 length:225 start_codon:yes stop_codon:yes gene_type:complete
MTIEEDIIRMAREAGAWSQQKKNCEVEHVMSAESLERFAALVRADEREGCAALCDQLSDSSRDLRFGTAIRART